MPGSSYARANASQSVTVAILHRNAFDCDTLELLVPSLGSYRVAGAATSLDSFLETCDHTMPHVAILDASYPLAGGDIFLQAAELKRQSKLNRILFFDEVPNRTRAQRAIDIDGAGYVTRQRTVLQFVSAIAELTDGRPPLDGFVVDWLSTPRRLQQRLHSTSPVLAGLSPRELDVFELLAQGQSVADCARILRLTTSTIANHKTRLMKKLSVNKSNQLIHIAIREGVIAP